MSQKRFKVFYNLGNFTAIDVNVAQGRRSSVRKFMAMLTAMAVVVAGLTVGVAAPAQAAVTSADSAFPAGSFNITLTPAGNTFVVAAGATTKTNYTSASPLLQAALQDARTTIVNPGGGATLTFTNVSLAAPIAATSIIVADAALTNAGAGTIAVAVVPIRATLATPNAANNRFLITLTNARFKTGAIAAGDFTFAGPDAAALAGGTFTQLFGTGDTVVAITGVTGLTGADNTVTPGFGTLATFPETASMAFTAGTQADVVSPAFTLAVANNVLEIRLANPGQFASSISAASFAFTGSDAEALSAGTFTRIDAVLVLVTGFSGRSGTNNTVTVRPAALVRDGTVGTTAGNFAVTAAFVTGANTRVVTVTLAGGTFAEDVALGIGNVVFTGTNAARLNAGGAALAIVPGTGNTVIRVRANALLVAAADDVVTVNEAEMTLRAASTAATASVAVAVTSNNVTPIAANNRFTVTLDGGGEFKAAPIVGGDFTFAGPDAVALAGGTFTRVNDTVVAITGVTGLIGADNNVTVPAATQFRSTATVAFAAVTQAAIVSPAFTLAAENNSATITLTDGRFTPSISAASFVFGGLDAAALSAGTFTRVSDTVVRVTGFSGRTGTNNTVTVQPAALAVNGTVAGAGANFAVAASITPNPANNTITITLNGGTFGPTVSAATFSFGGSATNAARLALGSYQRTSDSVVTISSLTGLVAEATTITVPAGNMALRAAAVLVVGTSAPAPTPEPAPVPAPAPAVVPGPGPIAAPVPVPVAVPTPNDPIQALVNEVLGATPTQVQRLTAAQLAALPPAAFAVMSPAQVKALNPAQVSGFSAAQIQAIPTRSLRAMKPVTVKKFSVTQIRALTNAQALDLRTKQIKALGPVKRKIVNSKR